MGLDFCFLLLLASLEEINICIDKYFHMIVKEKNRRKNKLKEKEEIKRRNEEKILKTKLYQLRPA